MRSFKPSPLMQRGYGATAARLTPDQKVGSSNLSGLNFSFAAAQRLQRNGLIQASHACCPGSTPSGYSPLGACRLCWGHFLESRPLPPMGNERLFVVPYKKLM